MKILVTAGNTQALIDKVRCITNIFSGRTGATIALHAHERGHQVTLLTSHPEVVPQLSGVAEPQGPGWGVHPFRSFEDLRTLMQTEIVEGRFDAVVHCAAVSDYLSAGIYSPAAGT